MLKGRKKKIWLSSSTMHGDELDMSPKPMKLTGCQQ